MLEKFENAGGIIGFISSIISIVGAIISIVKSRSAKKSLDEINIKKSAIEVNDFKEKLNKLYVDISKHIRARKSNRGLDSEAKRCEEWLNMISDLVLNLPNEFTYMEEKLKQIRSILKEHVYENKSLHDTPKGDETMFAYLEGVIYGFNIKANRESE